MDFNCYDAMPSNDEIAIVDQEAARAAATSLAPDVEILGLVMSVPEVFRRGDMKIVRINLLDGESNDLRAVAARIYKDGEVHEFVCKL
ncbi:hypothetical protein [Erythrobacter aurantius]|uniref:hypothetical protein n=1 Tax=Erythrobacter aurantius TaxID=2909249 RepID=UPI002079430D|nr:hypothetical protein [Erythrobacter aurantius]